MSGALRKAAANSGLTVVDGAPHAPRHFLDLRDFEPATLRQMLDIAVHYKKARGVLPARPLAGKSFRTIRLASRPGFPRPQASSDNSSASLCARRRRR